MKTPQQAASNVFLSLRGFSSRSQSRACIQNYAGNVPTMRRRSALPRYYYRTEIQFHPNSEVILASGQDGFRQNSSRRNRSSTADIREQSQVKNGRFRFLPFSPFLH